MTSKKGPAKQKERIHKNLESIDSLRWAIHNENRNPRSEYNDISVETEHDHWTSYYHVFDEAYEGLRGDQVGELEKLSDRALATVRAVKNRKLKFRVGKTEQSPLTLHISVGPKQEDLLLFIRTWEYLAPMVGREEEVSESNKGQIIKGWTPRSYDAGCAFLGTSSSSTPASVDFYDPKIFSRGDHFIMKLRKHHGDPEEKIRDFKKWIRNYAMPSGYPVIGRIGSLLGEGYKVWKREEEKRWEEKGATERIRILRGLAGKEI